MKIKTIVKVSILAIVVGFIFTCIGYAFNNEKVINESEELEEFKNINIISDLNNIEIIPSDKYKITLNYKKDYTNIDYRIEKETLIVTQHKVKNDVYNLEDYKENKNNSIKIYLPEYEKINNLRIESNVSNIYLSEVNINDLDLSCDTGNINIENCKVDKANLLTNTGNIEANNLDGLNVRVNSNMGNINFKNSTIRKVVEANNNLGYTKFQGELLGDIYFTNNLGNIEVDINDKEKKYNYNLNSSYGSVIINDKLKNKIFKENNNSKYNINLKCDSGNIKLKSK